MAATSKKIAGRVTRRRRHRGRDALVEDVPELEDVTECREHVIVCLPRRPVSECAFFDHFDLASGYGLLGEPVQDLERAESDGRDLAAARCSTRRLARCARFVPTSKRVSPPPTSFPRSMSTTPNSGRPARHVLDVSTR